MIRSRYAITDFPDGTHLIKFDMHDEQHRLSLIHI